MRLLPTGICRPGMRLGKKIFSEDGTVLLTEHAELTDGMLRRLQEYGVDFIYVSDPRTEDVEVPELLTEETRMAATRVVRTHFRKFMEDSNKKRMVHTSFFSKDFRNIINMMIDDLSRNKDAMIMLTTMQLADHYLFQHSMNVCIYSTLLGLSAGYAGDELMTLSLGALLHDVGKTRIDQKH